MNEEEENELLDRLLIGIVGGISFLILTIVLMIPILNVYIAYKIFGE